MALNHAPEDLAALIAEVERLRAVVEEVSHADEVMQGTDPAVLMARLCGVSRAARVALASKTPGTGQGGPGPEALQGSAERLERCGEALARAHGLVGPGKGVLGAVRVAISKIGHAQIDFVGEAREAISDAIAACKAAGLWEAAVNRPSQGVRLTPLALALEEARAALEPSTGEQRVEQNLQEFLAERFKGRQPGPPLVTVSVPDPQPLPADFTFPLDVASSEMQRLCAARARLDCARETWEGHSMCIVPTALYDAIKSTDAEEMLRLAKDVYVRILQEGLDEFPLGPAVYEAVQILLTPQAFNPESPLDTPPR